MTWLSVIWKMRSICLSRSACMGLGCSVRYFLLHCQMIVLYLSVEC